METKTIPPAREIPAMHTFAEEMGQPPFDWNAFLAQETYTPEELDAALFMARDWVTCACGNQCAKIPRSGGLAPDDDQLRSLGGAFAGDISMLRYYYEYPKDMERSRAEAKATLAAIELRSAALLAQGKGAQS